MIVIPRRREEQPVPVRAECPLCHCPDAHLLYRVRSDQAVAHVLGRDPTPDATALRAHVEGLWHAETCEFVRCDRCSLCYADPFVPGDAAFYERVYRDDSGYTGWRWEFEKTREAIRRLLSDRADAPRLLEIGAGDGAFVREIAPDLLPKERVECTEHSAYGRDRINDYGIRCRSVDIGKLGVTADGAFEIVCMFEVLEHLGDIDRLFADLSRATTPLAHLFIGVPNDASRDAFDALGFAEDVPPTHISRWSRACFDFAARANGWTVVESATEPLSPASQIAKYAWFCYEQSPLAPRLDALRPGTWRRVLKGLVAGGRLVVSPWRPVLRLLSAEMGTVRWVHLERSVADADARPARSDVPHPGERATR